MASTQNSLATGKRKTAIARVWVRAGEGKITINEREIVEYFPRPTLRMIIAQPFDVIGRPSGYDVEARVHGGGIAAQASAIRHGICRALVEADPDLRSALRKAGFMTRDSRIVERKKYGRHKARKRPQYSKR
ncbi:MAG: 30S ribosomal protein S9 [Deltaproteobacteria bacterium]|nr:30S ribosomal protein S9 [Deltaproteobacteria bacterium]